MKIIVGLSGGVDSSVAAYLLKEQGHTVEGVFMKNWEEDDTDTYCSAAEDIKDAQAVCDILNIPLHTINFAAEYWDNVFEHFLSEYKAGRTPNPDILCNKEIKFKAFLAYAIHLGADAIATGHYARNLENHLAKAIDKNKDQSYFLYTLSHTILEKVLFPLGNLTKPEVRKIAEQQHFPNHKKKDSTGICFIGERKFKTFLNQYLPAQPGEIVTPDGKVLAQHDGLMFYTLGQREGLGIGGRKEASEAPWYVAQKDLENNRLIVVQGKDHPLLFSRTLCCEQADWVQETPPSSPFSCTAKTRYRQEDEPCNVTQLTDTQYKVDFHAPQRAVTPGQSVVFYQGDICLGGAIITR